MVKLKRHFLLADLDWTIAAAERKGSVKGERKITLIKVGMPVWRQILKEQNRAGYTGTKGEYAGFPVQYIPGYWHDFVIVTEVG